MFLDDKTNAKFRLTIFTAHAFHEDGRDHIRHFFHESDALTFIGETIVRKWNEKKWNPPSKNADLSFDRNKDYRAAAEYYLQTCDFNNIKPKVKITEAPLCFRKEDKKFINRFTDTFNMQQKISIKGDDGKEKRVIVGVKSIDFLPITEVPNFVFQASLDISWTAVEILAIDYTTGIKLSEEEYNRLSNETREKMEQVNIGYAYLRGYNPTNYSEEP